MYKVEEDKESDPPQVMLVWTGHQSKIHLRLRDTPENRETLKGFALQLNREG
jgi:hypothetical protein